MLWRLANQSLLSDLMIALMEHGYANEELGASVRTWRNDPEGCEWEACMTCHWQGQRRRMARRLDGRLRDRRTVPPDELRRLLAADFHP